MVIIVTAISGSDKDGALDRLGKYAVQRGKKVKIFKTGDMIFEDAEQNGVHITPEFILNTPAATINTLRSIGLEKICAQIPQLISEDYCVVVTLHVMWYWVFRYRSAFNPYYLKRIGADMYVNLLNNVEAIEASLRSRRQWDILFGRRRHKNYAREKILDWQSVEFESTRDWSRQYNKPFFAIPSKASPSALYRLAFEPWRKIYYVGIPLTLLRGDKFVEARKKIDDFLEWLEKYIVVIDPRYIEPLTDAHLAVVDRPVYSNVVARDLEYLIPFCRDGMIAYFPVPIGSSGVAIELKTVYENNAETNLIYPPDNPLSPFYVNYAHNIYRREDEFKEEFLKRLGKEYLERVEEAERGYNEVKNG